MRIHFTRDYDYRTPEVTISYAKGDEKTVTKEIGEAAIAAGAGREADTKAAATPSPPPPPTKSDG